MKNSRHCKTWQRKAAAVVLASCFVITSPVYANPTGASVASGVVSMAQQGNTLNITNSPGAIINWQGFSVGVNEATRFIQQSAASSVLNRVVGQDPSSILGALQSNGRVFLINPNGVLFGAGAQVDVAGLVVSTLNLSNADFLAGRYNFTAHASAGGIENQGNLTALPGGQIYLVAPNLSNSGLITSPQGGILLAAGNSVELVNANTPDMRVVIDAPSNEVLNLGSIVANSGRIGIYAGLINHHGIVSADSAALQGGKIVFKATKDVTLEAGSTTTANGPQGGSITIQSGTGITLVAGDVAATGDQGKGGEVQVLGNLVGLIGNASIGASGQTGGGSVLIGGDRHGDNPSVQNAWRTYFGLGATVKADAIQSGDGGKVIVWSDDITRFYGNIFARGGANGGNGGFVEVSGKGFLVYRGTADLSAPAGSFGTLLLDPRDITIQATGANDNELSVSVPAGQLAGQILFADANSTTDFTLTAATVSASLANVVLQAQRDINVNAAVRLQNDVNFIAQAGRDINVNAALTTNGVTAGKGNIHLEADSPHFGTSDGIGMVNINAPANACGGAAGGCAGGNITLIGGGSTSPQGGFGFSLKADVQAGDGGINVALSQNINTPALNFLIGAGGNAQLSSNDTGSLLSTGRLILGTAMTAGTDGYGAGANPLRVNSLSQLNAGSMTLSANSGSTFELDAGIGGITLNRNLTTFQPTFIDTTGAFTLNAALDTSNHNLVITAASVNLGVSGSITTGTGTFGCFAGSGCPPGSVLVDQWTGLGGDGLWLTPFNWSLNALPTSVQVALIGTGAGAPFTVQLGNALQPANASVGLLVNNQTLNVLGNSTNKTTLNISSANGSTVSINTGTMTLTDSILGGTGLLNNQGTLNITNSTVAATINQTAGTLNASGTNLISGGLTIAGGTAFSIASGITTVTGATGVGTYAGNVTIASGANLALTGGLQNVITGGSITGSAGSTVDVAGATVNLATGTTLSAATLNLSGGSVGGTGNLTVTTDFNQTGLGTLGTSFTDLALTRSLGIFNVPTLGASHNISLTTVGQGMAVNGAITAGNHASLVSSGAITLSPGSTITANGTGDALFVVAGTTFSNAAGATALSTPTPGGRWLVYSTGPAVPGENRGGLVYDFKQYNATYGMTTVLGTGNGFLYSVSPNITPSLSGTAAKVYDGTVTAPTGSLSVTAGAGVIDIDTVTLALTGANYSDKNVGAGKPVTATGISITGASNGGKPVYGYQLASMSANAAIGVINPAVLNLSGTRAYDATTTFAAAVFGTSGTIGGVIGETLTLTGAGSVASPQVGSYALNVTGLTLGNGTGLASNYTLTGGTGTITSPTITEQLVNTQIIQLNYLDNILTSSSALNPINPIVSAELLATSVYLETPTGQTMPLTPMSNIDFGVYINIDTGGATLIQAGAILEPGIYFNQATHMVWVVTLDQNTGQTAILTGQTMPLTPMSNIDPGVYTNRDTGEATLIQAGATLEPGIYFNQATNTVVVVTLDQNTGQTVILAGSASEFQVVAGAQVVRGELNACR